MGEAVVQGMRKAVVEAAVQGVEEDVQNMRIAAVLGVREAMYSNTEKRSDFLIRVRDHISNRCVFQPI